MPASEARILANRQNSLKSTGPRTAEGKAASSANAIKHGLACETLAADVDDSAKVARLTRELEADLRPTCAVGRSLVDRIARLTVRLDRCARHDSASVAANVARALAEFEDDLATMPEEVAKADPAVVARLRSRVADLALFDPSREACLARRHEADAERGLYRALRELRLLKAEQGTRTEDRATATPTETVGEIEAARAALASFRRDAEAAPIEALVETLASIGAGGNIDQVPVSAALASNPPDRPVPTPKPPHLNRRQRRAALARRA